MIRQLKNIGHLLLALLANVYYGFPSRRLYVIGVTGTDGKTTTTSLIYHILKENKKKVAMITSVGAHIGGKQYDIGFHVTTPSTLAVQRYLKKAADERHEFVVLETTSHGLDQHRSWGVRYQIGVLTNITREHLDYHKTYDAYLTAKAKLLNSADVAIINRDDTSYDRVHTLLGGKQVISYSISHEDAEVTKKKYPLKHRLLGRFNDSNVLAGAAACIHAGLTLSDVQKALETYTPPQGRQEIAYDKTYTVMVDFAHTAGSFEHMLPEMRKLAKKRLIHMFGSAAKRDVYKRSVMGKWSSKYADIIILTAEDPRDESIVDICKAIEGGIGKKFVHIKQEHLPFLNNDRQLSKKEIERLAGEVVKYQRKKKKVSVIIPDRKQAIQFALGIAQKGDLVLTTGKSHEKSMNYGAGEEPWDEFEVIKNALR